MDNKEDAITIEKKHDLNMFYKLNAEEHFYNTSVFFSEKCSVVMCFMSQVFNRKNFTHLVLLSVCLMFQIVLKSQNQVANTQIKFRNFSMEDGLSMSTIMSISQTQNGYMWFATPDKLNRFDGYGFKTYKYESNRPHSLSDNYLTALLALPNGNLLIAAHNGAVDNFDPVSERVKHFEIWDNPDLITEIRGFCLLNDSFVMIYTMGMGMCKLNFYSGKYQWYTSENTGVISNYIQAMIRYNKDTFVYATNVGMNYFTSESVFFLPSVHLKYYSIGSIAHFEGALYAASQSDGLFKVTKQGKEIAINIGKTEEEFLYLNMLLADSRGNLWVGSTFDGLAKISSSGKQRIYKKSLFDKFSLVNNTVYTSFEDNTGNIWFGTISGISAYMPINQQFAFYRPSPEEGNGLSNKQVYFVYEDNKSQVWIGTLEGGLNLFNPKEGLFTYYDKQNTTGLGSNSIRSIFQDKKDRYWVGTGDKGLYRFFPEQRKFVAATDLNGEALTYMPVRALQEGFNGELWLGTQEGLLSWVPETRAVKRYFGLGFPDYSNSIVYEIKKVQGKKQFWVATFGNGLLVFDPNKGLFVQQFLANDKDSFSLNNNNIMCLRELNGDTLLVGTFGGGVGILDIKSKRFSHLSESDGLPNDAVYGILVDDLSRWWISTNKGIASINPRTGRIKKFDNIEQVQSLEFNEGAYMKGSNGLFYFGGIEGLNVFDPLNIKYNTHAPVVHLTGMTLFDKKMPVKQGVVYGFKQNFLGFEFVGLSFATPDKVTYQYRLEGVDENWVEAGSRRFVQYTSLRPGEYIFEARALNEEGVVSLQTANVSFVIKPPFWLTYWFIIGGSACFLFVVYAGYKFRTNKIKKDYQFKLAELEIKALRSQMNPHFIFNSINSIQYYILNKSPQVAYSYLAKFSSLMRKILQNSRVNFITIEEELASLTLYIELENIRLDGELKYELEIDEAIDKEKVHIPSMILQPFVENAIIHGLLNKQGEKTLKIKLFKEVSHLYCEIEDNGIGREKAKILNEGRTKKHQSMAMNATKERLDILNRANTKKVSVKIVDLLDTNAESAGTKVQVIIPFLSDIRA